MRKHEQLMLTELGTPKQIWIAYHAPGMTALLQLCFHKGASMACALQRIAGIQRTNAASEERMLGILRMLADKGFTK